MKTAKIAAPIVGVEAVPVDDGEGEPVVGAALGEGHAEHDHADEEQPHVAPDREALAQALASTARVGASWCGSSPSSSRTRHEPHGDDHAAGDEHAP